MQKTDCTLAISVDRALRERAANVIPGGMWGHQSAKATPSNYPQFFTSGAGARVRDVDGREYIDFMCAWGPVIVGHNNPTVEAAANAQTAKGVCLNGPTEHCVDLAELMVETVTHASWATFQKNGSDAMTTCVTVARAGTQKRKILLARGAYHGAVPWCSPSLVGITAEDRVHLVYYEFNDVESLEAAFSLASGDLAAVIVSGFKHDLSRPLEMPTATFAKAARAGCDRAGAALIVDDVRAGFRLDLGGSWELVGVQPDLSAFSKSIANGHPLAAVTGNDAFRDAAQRVYATGSFWYSGGPMAAACATIRELKRLDGPALMQAAGQRFRDGLDEQSKRHGFELVQSGPPAMPMVQFKEDDADFTLGDAFCTEALKRGVYLHHRHNMFLSTDHDHDTIDAALNATDDAFAVLARTR